MEPKYPAEQSVVLVVVEVVPPHDDRPGPGEPKASRRRRRRRVRIRVRRGG